MDLVSKSECARMKKVLPELKAILASRGLNDEPEFSFEIRLLHALIYEPSTEYINPSHLLHCAKAHGAEVSDKELERAKANTNKAWRGQLTATLQELIRNLADNQERLC